MVYQPIVKPTANTKGASSSKDPIVSNNSYELLSDYGDMDNDSVLVEIGGKKELEKNGYFGDSTPHQSSPAKATPYVDDFDDDVDEHIELPNDV